MAKIQLSPETRAQERRRPGFALLKISGWKHSPELSEMSIQRSEDEKYLGADGQWEPIPVWHTLAEMTQIDDESIEADVPPAFVDPIIIAPNNSYRVTLKSGSESETRTMRIANGVLASTAAGSSPESLEQGNGLILGDTIVEPIKEIEPASEPEVIEDVIEEELAEPKITSVTEVKKDSFFVRHKGKIITVLIILLLILATALAWYFKLIPLDSASNNTLESTATKTSTVDPASKNLSDLELLQKFIRSKPDTDQILAQAKEWQRTKHCDAMLRLMVHSAHKSKDSKIAFEYGKMHDPAHFKQSECIEKSDVDTAQYWYQKAIEAGNDDAKSALEKLEKK